jgi:hypothetical protein
VAFSREKHNSYLVKREPYLAAEGVLCVKMGKILAIPAQSLRGQVSIKNDGTSDEKSENLKIFLFVSG